MKEEALISPTILVLLGSTGDLARRKLIPAIEALANDPRLPEHFHVIAVTRQADFAKEALFGHIENPVFVHDHLSLFTMDMNVASEYTRLAERITEIESEFGTPAQHLYYLSVPTRAFESIVGMLGESGLLAKPDTKLLLEKPFGTDLASATALIASLHTHVAPEQVYRIDHYLAKDFVFPELQSDLIENIDIHAYEKIGIENRAAFYEQTGALRDLIQSHLLQLAAVTLSKITEKTASLSRLRALNSMHLMSDVPIESVVRRGQYAGYKDEVKNPESSVETYVAVTLESSLMPSVPITLSTGKKLAEKETEIHIRLKKENVGVSASKASEIVVRDMAVDPHGAYKQVFIDAMSGDQGVFVSDAEVFECWRIIAPIQEAWQKTNSDVFIYTPGTNP